MKTKTPFHISHTTLLNIFFGALLGIFYTQGSKITEFSKEFYVLLWFYIYIQFFNFKLNFNNTTIVLFLVFVWSSFWVISVLLGSKLDMVIWKASVGMMWLMIGLIVISAQKFNKKKEFFWFLNSFGISFLIITIASLDNTIVRVSFIGDPIAPHVFATALILTGSAIITYNNLFNTKIGKIMSIVGISLVSLSLLTLSKTSFFAVLLLIIFFFKRNPLLMSTCLICLLIFFFLDIFHISNTSLSRIYTFKLGDASIGGRFNLFLETSYSSFINAGMPGFIDFPKIWIDTSIGSMISTFGLLGTIPIMIFVYRQVKFLEFNLATVSLILIFLTTEHLILPRILIPFTLLIISTRFSSVR